MPNDPEAPIDPRQPNRSREPAQQPTSLRGTKAFTLLGREQLGKPNFGPAFPRPFPKPFDRGRETGGANQPASIPTKGGPEKRHGLVPSGAGVEQAKGAEPNAKAKGREAKEPAVSVGDEGHTKAASAEAPVEPALPFSRDSISAAAAILRKIFTAFSSARESRMGQAYRQLQRDLSANADILILSGQITLPQIIDTMQKMEEYLGPSTEEDSGQDASEMLHRWLNGEDRTDFDQVTSAAAQG